MKRRRKSQIVAAILAAFIILSLVLSFVACGRAEGTGSTSDDDTIQVVATIFPAYDWTRQILGDDTEVELTLLLDDGVDLHSYQPTAADMIKISTCDLFIYVGGESDDWIEDALAEATNKDMKVINLLEVLGDSAKEEELVEGMEGEEEDSDEAEYDEHVWLSLQNAELFTEKIANTIAEIAPENADVYEANAKNYAKELATLDAEYQSMVEEADTDTLLFGDRFPFRYLVDDYNLNYYAAFAGCSAETDASFETITFLAGKLDELNLSTVLVIDQSDQKIAETIINNTENKNQTIRSLNSMQAVTAADIEDGATYLSIMEENLNVLKESL